MTATWLYVEGLDKSDAGSESGETSDGRTGPQTPLGTGQWGEERQPDRHRGEDQGVQRTTKTQGQFENFYSTSGNEVKQTPF